MGLTLRKIQPVIVLIMSLTSYSSGAAIVLDRNRVIFNGGENTVSLTITNNSADSPFMAHAWLEDEKGEKVSTPFVILPPLQRIAPGGLSQVKIQALPMVEDLPQNRESLFWLNLREIPPKSKKENVLQIALQSRIKLFYRPRPLVLGTEVMTHPFQEKLTMTRENNSYRVSNPTPYYITLVDARRGKDGETAAGFSPFMLSPHGETRLGAKVDELGEAPVLTYINDYGGRPQLTFHCSGVSCSLQKER